MNNANHTSEDDNKRKKLMGHFWVFLRLLPLLWSRDSTIRLRLVISILLLIISIVLNVTVPIFLKNIFDLLAGPGKQCVHYAVSLAVAYGLLWTLAQAMSSIKAVAVSPILERQTRILSQEVFEHLHNLSYKYHVERKTGGIINAIDKIQSAISKIFYGLLFNLLPLIFETLSAVIILWGLYGIQFGLILLGIILAYSIFSILSTKKSVQYQRMYHEKDRSAGAFIVDSLLNFETVKYFNNQQYESQRCSHFLIEREEAAIKTDVYMEKIGLFQVLIIGIGMTILVAMASQRIVTGQLQIGDFVLLNGYLLQFAGPLGNLGYILRNLRQGLTTIEQAFQILSVKPDILDLPQAKPLRITHAEVVFHNVEFGYDPRRPILSSFNLRIPSRKTLAIVGETGAGKSTIPRLLFRFYDVSKGQILIDGQNIRQITQESLRSAVGIVSQDVTLFNTTIYQNISYGRPDATKEEVYAAARIAHIDTFIRSLPDGYDTLVGERGIKLSGGEKQRIGIARIVLKKPSIYVFDEATSALDMKTERAIQSNLNEISRGSTTIIIAHRLSTVVHADKIVVLSKGKIVEMGSHSQLLSLEGHYSRLWARQVV